MKNFIIKLFLNSIAVVFASYLLSGVHVQSFGYAILVAFTLSLLNMSIKPLLIIFTLPVTIFSLGLFLLVINAAIIMLAARIIGSGFIVDGWWWALLFSLLLSVLNSILESIFKAPIMAATSQKEKDMKIYDKDGNRIA